jgi:predicted metalloenzyme YecM
MEPTLPHPVTEVLGDIDTFVSTILSALQRHHIDISSFPIDHICYRVASDEEYKLKKEQLVPIADLLSEAIIGGRSISTYKLQSPYQTSIEGISLNGKHKYVVCTSCVFDTLQPSHTAELRNRNIPLVEVPSPKGGRQYRSGLEHVEFVIGENASLTELMNQYPQVIWDTSEMEKATNPAIRLTAYALCSGLDASEGSGPPPWSAKFHQKSLEEVIDEERKMGF